ncbi:MAG: hypothetical protein IKX20_08640 [Paludibacteraceae bacterium]|nr:hypothetical protein [Paludibacteraceae bacterium]
MKEGDIILGYAKAAEICGVSGQTIANWVKKGKLQGCYTKLSERKIAFSYDKLINKLYGEILQGYEARNS